uniref:Uncharacterized protein n=1 Tax=Oryza sativa subsp. japonica TaxID=39947 RepID=Q84YS2_ORYSJ|nr:hypothetical protein [Oryza sativa Japonica Group]
MATKKKAERLGTTGIHNIHKEKRTLKKAFEAMNPPKLARSLDRLLTILAGDVVASAGGSKDERPVPRRGGAGQQRAAQGRS